MSKNSGKGKLPPTFGQCPNWKVFLILMSSLISQPPPTFRLHKWSVKKKFTNVNAQNFQDTNLISANLRTLEKLWHPQQQTSKDNATKKAVKVNWDCNMLCGLIALHQMFTAHVNLTTIGLEIFIFLDIGHPTYTTNRIYWLPLRNLISSRDLWV